MERSGMVLRTLSRRRKMVPGAEQIRVIRKNMASLVAVNVSLKRGKTFIGRSVETGRKVGLKSFR